MTLRLDLRRISLAAATAFVAACTLTTSLDGLAGAPAPPDGGGSDGGGLEDGPRPTGDAEAGALDASTCDANTTSDPSNCGACSHSCAGSSCSDSVCQPTNVVGGDIVCVAVDDLRVFWANGAGDVRSQPKNGGATVNYYDGGLPIGRCAVDSAVFLLTYSGGSAGVVGYPKAGGGSVQVVSGQSGTPFGVVSKAGVFFTNRASNEIGTCTNAPCNGSPTVLAAMQNDPWGITVDNVNVYWTNRGDGSVRSVARSPGGQVSTLATQQSGPSGIAVDATDLYWANQSGTIMKLSLTTAGAAPQPIATGQSIPESLVIDDANVYWVNGGAGEVVKLAKAGGKPLVLATAQNAPSDLAVDATHVYWATRGGGISRVAK